MTAYHTQSQGLNFGQHPYVGVPDFHDGGSNLLPVTLCYTSFPTSTVLREGWIEVKGLEAASKLLLKNLLNCEISRD
jgi:hypothetical protein